MSKDGDHITNPTLVTNLVPLPEEDQDSDKYDDVDDLTRGPIAFNRERTYDLSKDSEDSEDSRDSEDTLSRIEKDLEEARPELKEETSNVADTLGSESQYGVTKSFGAATITHPPIQDSSSNTSLSREEIMDIKEQNHVEALRRLVKSWGMSIVSCSSSSSVDESNLNEDSAHLQVEQLKAYAFGTGLSQSLKQNHSTEIDF